MTMKHTRFAGPLLITATLAACAPQVAPSMNQLTVAAAAPPASLDFTTTGGAAAPQALMGNIYETLVRIDASGQPQPHLATSWDAVSYTHLTLPTKA